MHMVKRTLAAVTAGAVCFMSMPAVLAENTGSSISVQAAANDWMEYENWIIYDDFYYVKTDQNTIQI
ncbi:MAG: hypothetical protein K2I93_09025, partial [Oscillospiraceae bacterium]|nr:hypothetical protein [Oscillospiraceae bacterium]